MFLDSNKANIWMQTNIFGFEILPDGLIAKLE